MLAAQAPESILKVEGLVTTAVVGHDTGDGDIEAFVIGHGRLEERYGAFRLLVRQNLAEGDAGVIVDTDMNELPADATAVALTGAIAGDAVTDLVKTTELLDVDVDQLAGMFALIATHRLGRLQVAYPV